MSRDDRGDPPSALRLAAWGLFLFVLAAFVAQNVFHCAPASPLVGQPAPPFESAIVAGDGAGDRVALDSLRGRVVMLDFWASWCPPCRESIPILSRLAARHAAAGLVTLGVNVEGERPPSFVARAHRTLRAGFPSLHDLGAMQSGYGVRSLPTLVLVDRRGLVRRVEIGVPSESGLDAEIRGMLAEDP